MADTSTTITETPGLSSISTKQTSSAAANSGNAIMGAVCAIAIFHVNELLLRYGLTPIPTEIAAQYQIVFSFAGGVLAHRWSSAQ